MFIHVYFTFKLVVKRKWWLRRGFYKAICHDATSKSTKMAFIVWISWKNGMICSVHMHSELKVFGMNTCNVTQWKKGRKRQEKALYCTRFSSAFWPLNFQDFSSYLWSTDSVYTGCKASWCNNTVTVNWCCSSSDKLYISKNSRNGLGTLNLMHQMWTASSCCVNGTTVAPDVDMMWEWI